MESLRLVSGTDVSSTPCDRCQAVQGRWDRIAGKVMCPQCEESLLQGETAPLREPSQPNRCAICNRLGTVCYLTYPLQSESPVEIDLCGQHLRDLLGRRLGPYAYYQLRRQLRSCGFEPTEVFLLHEAFYDEAGRALRPIVD